MFRCLLDAIDKLMNKRETYTSYQCAEFVLLIFHYYFDNGVIKTLKRRFLSLVFACLCE